MKSVRRIALALVVAGLALAGATSLGAYPVGWLLPAFLSIDHDPVDKDVVDIAGVEGRVAVAWAHDGAASQIVLAEKVDKLWTTPVVFPAAAGHLARSPSVDYVDDTQLAVAWAERSIANPTVIGIFQQDAGSPTPLVVAPDLRSASPDPHLDVAPDGAHIVFAASQVNATDLDLYHAYRPDDHASWMTPTVVVTHAQVAVVGRDEGIRVRSPQVAVASDGATVHVVWDQQHGGTLSRSIWHISGTLTLQGPQWHEPELLSNPAHNAVLPALAAGPGGAIHVIWSQTIGPISEPSEQYIRYCRLPGCTNSAVLNAAPLVVASNLPKIVVPALACRDAMVCAVWYDRDSSLPTAVEDVAIRCSEDGGLTWWPTHQNVSSSADWLSVYPAVTVERPDLVHVAWVEYDLAAGETEPHALGVFHRYSGRAVFLPIISRGG
jgi:hypothetical protein